MPKDDEAPPPATYNVSGKPWGIAEGERIFLSIRPDPDSSLVLRGFDYTFVPNASNPDATVEITLHHQRRGKATSEWASEPFLLYRLTAGQAIRLELNSDETLALYRHIQDLYAIGAEGVPRGEQTLQVHDAGALVATGDLAEQIKALIEKHGEGDVLAGVQALLPDPVEVVALKREHEKRSAAVTEFETHLAWNDWSELEWQAFFRRNDWIFGHGLDYHFLVSQLRQPDFGGQDLAGKGGQRGDELMSTAGNVRFAVLVELKKPRTDLLGGERYRNGAWSIGEELAGGVAQLQANLPMAPVRLSRWLPRNRPPGRRLHRAHPRPGPAIPPDRSSRRSGSKNASTTPIFGSSTCRRTVACTTVATSPARSTATFTVSSPCAAGPRRRATPSGSGSSRPASKPRQCSAAGE